MFQAARPIPRKGPQKEIDWDEIEGLEQEYPTRFIEGDMIGTPRVDIEQLPAPEIEPSDFSTQRLCVMLGKKMRVLFETFFPEIEFVKRTRKPRKIDGYYDPETKIVPFGRMSESEVKRQAHLYLNFFMLEEMGYKVYKHVDAFCKEILKEHQYEFLRTYVKLRIGKRVADHFGIHTSTVSERIHQIIEKLKPYSEAATLVTLLDNLLNRQKAQLKSG